MKAERVSWMSPSLPFRSTAMTGIAGRYMSIDSGVKEDSSASTASSTGVKVGRVGFAVESERVVMGASL
jgi:hypothetical protein